MSLLLIMEMTFQRGSTRPIPLWSWVPGFGSIMTVMFTSWRGILVSLWNNRVIILWYVLRLEYLIFLCIVVMFFNDCYVFLGYGLSPYSCNAPESSTWSLLYLVIHRRMSSPLSLLGPVAFRGRILHISILSSIISCGMSFTSIWGRYWIPIRLWMYWLSALVGAIISFYLSVIVLIRSFLGQLVFP